MKMPFGMHKGQQVANLPLDYLNWLASNVPLRPPLSIAVEDALELARCSEPTPQVDGNRVHNVYRRLAMRWHPDRGGSNAAMAAISDFYAGLTTATA